MKWKNILLYTYVILAIFLIQSMHRFYLAIGSESFHIEFIILILYIATFYFHFSYIQNLNLVIIQGAQTIVDSLAVRKINRLETALYIGILLYILRIIENLTAVILLTMNNSGTQLFYILSILQFCFVIALLYLASNAIRIRKKLFPAVSGNQSNRFFGTWKLAVALILLGILKIAITGSIDGLSIGLLIFGFARLIMTLKKN